MKGKVLIVLFSLMLVFGMLVVSCDNGDFPKDPSKDAQGNDIVDNHKSAGDFEAHKADATRAPLQAALEKAEKALEDAKNDATTTTIEIAVLQAAVKAAKAALEAAPSGKDLISGQLDEMIEFITGDGEPSGE
jgi:hypothetical protein